MKVRKIKLLFFISVFLVGAISAFTPSDKYFAIAKNLDIFASLFKEVNALYVDEIDPELLIGTGIEAMLASLDPYTTYIPEEEVDNFRSLTTGHYAGIGAIISKMEDKVIVTMPYKSYAAHNAGIKVGDEIISVDGISVEGKKVMEISNMLKGQADTDIEVIVNRFGSEKPLHFNFKREKVKIVNVPFFGMIEEGVGYIKLEDFTLGAGREVGDALERLKLEGAEKIVLDLRNNPGGLLNEAINVVNIFIPKGKLVVETKGKVKEWDKSYKTLNNPLDTQIPLIVLVNENSASAAEIVSGAIQDYDRGLLIGRKTFGKGLVQTTRSLSYNTQLKITTAKYYTPSGRCIQSVDYSKRDHNGKAANIPDSLKVAFKTKNGRTVYDGDGLQPDIFIYNDEPPAVVQELIDSGYIFKYATQWHYLNPSKKKFEKTDQEYQKFKEWLKNKNFNYQTEVESLVGELKSSAASESYYLRLKDEIISLEQAVKIDKKNDLGKFQTEILELLEGEVAARIDLYEGQIRANFDNDKDVRRALGVFNKDTSLQQILSRN